MKKLMLTSLCLLLAASTGLADWDPGDDYKMHYPQLPDLTGSGWAVFGEYPRGLADDWQCNEDGPVADIHFWGSWKDDVVGSTHNIAVGIFANYEEGGEKQVCRPGALLWAREFTPSEYTKRLYDTGDQGWFNPYTPYHKVNDHQECYQYNITDITDPFTQEEGVTYWLAISMNFSGCHWGWNTSQDNWGCDAVYVTDTTPANPEDWAWGELVDPVTSVSLDLAFVITPEPTTICLLGLGALALARRRL